MSLKLLSIKHLTVSKPILMYREYQFDMYYQLKLN